MKKAVCLLSGGLDSTTSLYCALHEGFIPYALTIDYGQLHKKEIESAVKVVKHLNIEHEILQIQLPWGGSSLIDSNMQLPEHRSFEQMSAHIPNTYVPARNTIFISLAASMAEAKGAAAIFIGANALDYSGYPDCRPEYMEAMERALRLGTKQGVEGKSFQIRTPLLQLKKSDIIKLAAKLGAPLEWTWSCYKGAEVPCGVCDSCLLRQKGFEEAGMEDPASIPSPSDGGRLGWGSEKTPHLYPPPQGGRK